MIQTQFGSVPLRRPREPKEIVLHVNAGRDNSKVKIRRGWLKKDQKDAQKSEEYRISVKQAMLIASTQVEIEDLTVMQIDPSTGTWRTPEFILRRRQELDKKLGEMETGRGTVARKNLQAKESLQKQVHKLKKHVLTKRSAKCGSVRMRWFTISGGKLLVYKSDSQHAKPKKSYDLSKAKASYEFSRMPNMPSGEAFMSGKDHRICVICNERPQGPMYLYPDESDASKAAKQVKNWERACKMSKYLQSASDKEALSTVVQKVSGNVMGKGWNCLFQYAKEITDTKKTVRTFAMRLMKVEHSRGWNKARLVYKQRKQTLKLREDQQEYAARFLASRMQNINKGTVRPFAAVRGHMMTTIQQKFRHYRQEKIFDRVYALGNNSSSRIQQLRKGMVMDCAFQSHGCEDVLAMTIGNVSMDTVSMLKTKKASYTENNVPLHRAQVNASDSLTMLSFSEIEEKGFWEHKAEHQALAMGDWANFVNIDQISSVIVHCDRQLAQSARNEKHHELGPEVSNGVWFAINGPRVAWNRRIHQYEDRDTKAVIRDNLGAADCMMVARKLATGQNIKTLSIAVTVRHVHMPYVKKVKVKPTKDEKGNPGKDHVTQAPDTYLVINILGRQFKSKNASGTQPQFALQVRAEIPIADDDAALNGLDLSQVVVDIMEVTEDPLKPLCLWSGKLPLWKVFCPDRPGQHLMEGVKHLKARLDNLRSKGHDEEETEMHIPLSKTLPGGKGDAVRKISIYHCGDTIGDNWSQGNVELEFHAQSQQAPGGKMPISPELQGCGLVTSLYATHRGAWHSPEVGAKFSVENVASFVEFTLKNFSFADKDLLEEKKTCMYYIEAMCNGTSICCKPLTRSKKIWSQILKTSDSNIDFGERKLHVPIPPGAYYNGDVKVELTAFKVTVNEEPTMTFRELLSFNKRPRNSAQSIERVYQAIVSLAGMGVDQQRQDDNTIVMAKIPEPASEACPGKNIWGSAEQGATLKCNVVLRDRDFVRMAWTKKGEDKRALCVGDNAMLVCEEPLIYPKNELEFRHRFFPGDFDANKAKSAGTSKNSAELRLPSMSHEFERSNLSKADPKKYSFKQKYIPATAEEVIPYKFVLPESEIEFQKSGLHGVWWRIMDELASKVSEKDEKPTLRKTPIRVVESMTHTTKHVPITILAVYSQENHNATCDVEISPAFLFEWEQKPDRAYTLPGTVLMNEYQDASDSHVKSAPPGTGDVGQRRRRRVVLKDVPLARLMAVHSAGFNIYDAQYVSTEDVMATAPSMIRNDFNPRASAEESMMMGGQGIEKRGGYLISAGPLAADATASAAYEWTLYLHAPSDSEMYHFLAMLRHAVRMDFYNQQVKMREFQQRYVKTGNLKYQVGNALSSQSGYLEVVLVEAKRLVPKRVQKYKDMKERATVNARPEPNPYVIFKLLNPGEPKPYTPKQHGPLKMGEILIVQVQQNWTTPQASQDPNAPPPEDFALNFFDKAQNVVLHWALRFQGGKAMIRDDQNKVPVGQRAAGTWGTQIGQSRENPHGMLDGGQIPVGVNRGEPFEVRFERAAGHWEIVINGKHDGSYDFPSIENGKRKTRDEFFSQTGEITQVQYCGQPEHVMMWVVPRSELVYRGSRQQNAPVLQSSSSPSWARMDELAATGGWVFKTPPIDMQSHQKLIFEISVMDQQLGIPFEIGKTRMGVFGKVGAEGGAPILNLCDEKMPFQNLWLPLNTEDKAGKLVPNPSGEVHIMTRWVMNQSTQVARRLPKTARAFFKQELAPKLHSASLREPVYELQMRCTYNPNIAKHIEHPLTRSELVGQHAEELFNTMRYLACCEGRQLEAWDQYLKKLAENPYPDISKRLAEGKYPDNLAEFRNYAVESKKAEALFEIEENMRRGVPPNWRLADENVWHRMTWANEVKTMLAKKYEKPNSTTSGSFVAPYLALLEHSNSYKSDAMLQLQEDMVTAASWESSQYPQVVDIHLSRLKRARNICAALITFSYDYTGPTASPQADVEIPGAPNARGQNTEKLAVPHVADYRDDAEVKSLPGGTLCNGVAYCESLFVLAFFMLLPQIGEDKESKQLRSGMKSSTTKDFGKTNSNNTVAQQAELQRNNIKMLREAEEEAHIFCLLFTLIGASQNRAYADYYGVPTGGGDHASHRPLIADTSGVSEDIFHLNSALCRYDRELWIHMTALGFHLSSVFHGAFMRLFAFYMPTASVYRFWDLLFSESSKKDVGKNTLLGNSHANSKPNRHPLIDLAYGAMKHCRHVLLKCESEREFRDAIIGFLEALYDPSTMIEITTEAERDLWEALPSQIGVPAEHLRDFEANREYYRVFLGQFQHQNEVLAELTREVVVDTQQRANNVQGQGPGAQQAQQQSGSYDIRLTVRNVDMQVIPKIRTEFERELNAAQNPTNQSGMPDQSGKQVKKMGGMFRKTQDAICELGPQLESGLLGTVKYTAWSLMGPTANHLFQRAVGANKPEGHLNLPLPPFPELNPFLLDPPNIPKADWDRKVPLAVGPAWNNYLTKIYDTFKMVPDHISLNEFFTAVILCCKGTVGEKALALFRQFSYRDAPMALSHITPVMHHTKAVVEKVEGNAEREKATSYAPPNDEDVAKEVALHLQIYTHTQGEDMLLGEVYIQNLHPHIWAGMGQAPTQPYTIWGTKMRLPPGVVENAARTKDDPSKVRPYIGHLEMGIKWMPSVDKTKKDADRMGQLGVCVKSIYFDPNRVEAAQWKNPWIKVCTYDENFHPLQIPRWDPRNALRRGANIITAGIAYSGAFKDHIEFPETMRRDPLGNLHSRWLPGEGQHGWIPEKGGKSRSEGQWLWGDKYGDQYSVENFTMRKDFVEPPKDVKTNTISLQACRMITLAILRRSLHYITNREAMCVADSIFCRSGAVPGIIDAIIVHGPISPEYANPTQLKEAYAKAGKSCHDVKLQIVIQLGKQNNRHLGKMNLWDPSLMALEKLKLSDIDVHDPFPLQSKTLWIRFCKAGDGERGQQKISIDSMGHFHPEPVYLDKPNPVGVASSAALMQDKAQMTLSKEEFVNCIMNNPMLSESLRQLSSSDCSLVRCPQWKPIKLDVAITDPTAQQEDDDLFDVMNVRQSVLLELWDKDYSSKDDFLGECWLPPLGSIGRDKRTFVLTVGDASKGVGGTRPDAKKNLDATKMCTGDLTVQASWSLPAEDPGPEPENDNLESRVKREEKLHTGKLYLKIIKAEGLRVADVRRRHGSDPYVVAYCRNDCYDAKSGEDWRRNRITKLLEPLFETSVKKATINPEWNEDTTVELQTGAFEKRTKQRFAIHVTKRGRQEQIDAHAREVMAYSDELRLYFGTDDENRGGGPGQFRRGDLQKPGANHDVKIYLGDTVREFKNKVMVACLKEADVCKRANANRQSAADGKDYPWGELENKYRMVSMTFKHAVTVFQPSDKLRQLAAQKRTESHEYKRLYKNEENDPSCWEPLDPLRTFNHFAFFGFGQDRAQRLRITEGTEDYKLRNHRYRKFELDQKKANAKPEDTNTEGACFAFGQYKHKEDGDSTEWRACIVDRPESKDITTRSFKAKFVYTPKLGNPSQEAAAAHMGDQTKDDLDEGEVLLAPHAPKVLGSGHVEHQEFLAAAGDLQKAGKSIQEIAKILNDKLMMKFKLSQEGLKTTEGDEKKGEDFKAPSAPPPITVGEVAHHLAVLNATDHTPSQSGKTTPRSRDGSEHEGSRSFMDSVTSHFRHEPQAPSVPSQPSAPSQAPSTVPSKAPGGPPGIGGPPQRTGPPGAGPPGSGPQRTGPPGIGGPRVGAGGGGPQRG